MDYNLCSVMDHFRVCFKCINLSYCEFTISTLLLQFFKVNFTYYTFKAALMDFVLVTWGQHIKL